MTWNAFHRRGDVLRRVADAADLRRDGVLPTDVRGVAGTFTDDLDLVGALQLRWHQRLVGKVELHQQHQPMDLETAVRDGWVAAARSLPGLRLVVDQALAHPTTEPMARALARASVKERWQLALLAGLGSREDQRTEAAGRRIEAAARELWRPGVSMPTAPAVDISRHPVDGVPTAPAARPAPEPGPRTAPERVPAGSADFVRRLKAALHA